MRVLVLGGAGYIGSHAVYQLIEEGNEVVVIDSLKTGHRRAIHPKASFYEGDIRDAAFVRYVFQAEPIGAVLHFAASSLVGESMQDPLTYYDNNVYGTQNILGAMTEFGVKQIVFSSTAAVYGEPEEIPMTEAAPTNPTNPYGETKRTMEKMIHWAGKASDIRYVALRYFNVAGARRDGTIGEDHHPETHLIPIVLQTALKQRQHISIFGNDYPTPDGTCIRDYVHVDDLIQAHLRALTYLHNGGKSDVFNLGSSKGFSVKEIIEAAERVTGQTIPSQMDQRRDGDPAQLVAASDKAKAILHWQPQYPDVEEMIRDAWHWHRTHPNGYRTGGKHHEHS